MCKRRLLAAAEPTDSATVPSHSSSTSAGQGSPSVPTSHAAESVPTRQASTSTSEIDIFAATVQLSVNALDLLGIDLKRGLDLIGQCCSICRISQGLVGKREILLFDAGWTLF